ncbi:MAG: ABC transporter substrate-binding protein [Geopsychrobacter sp.]|nr:ABC transporter substrate-binding protein [Geopsychrobacter sp.]
MKSLFLGLIFSLCAGSLFAQQLDDLVFITEEYPPFNFTDAGEVQGIATDTLLEMLKLSGASQTRDDIGSLSWARGYDIALHTEDVLLYSMTRTAAREKLFKWVGPIIRSKIVLFARKDHHLTLKSIDEINQRKLRVGVVLNDVGEQILQEQGVERARIYRFNKGVHLAQMLEKERIDLLAYGRLVTLWNLKSLGYEADSFEAIFTLQEAEYYYALNIKTDDRTVEQLQTALDQVKASGTLDSIIHRYIN